MKGLANGKHFVFRNLIFLLNVVYRFFIRLMNAIHRKKRYAIPFYLFNGYLVLVVSIIKFSGDSRFEKRIANKFVNDVTQINPIHVNREIQPQSTDEIVSAIRNTSGPISIGGGRFSMGGQIGYENSLHLDMRMHNKILRLDTIAKQVTVQSGIVWRDLQTAIDRHNLSIKIMQTYANFTVGGSISVNCHGRYIGHGPMVSSILEIKLVTASGEVVTANRNENKDIFAAAIGGYGGIGVITEATLQLTDNVKVQRETKLVPVGQYLDFFYTNIRNKEDVIFQNGDLYPPDFDQINSVAWRKSDKELTDTVRVTPAGESYWIERQLMKVVSSGTVGKKIRRDWLDPYLYRTQKVVWRNREASYDVAELEPKSREQQTYVLQEYFIPIDKIESFIPKMKAIYHKYNVNVVNISLRHAHADDETYLSWAAQEVFAFVIYYKQGTDAQSREHVRQWTVAMTDAILSEGGRWYLPYQPHATTAQFKLGYSKAPQYFEVKNRLDPEHRFTNKLLDKYNPFVSNRIEKKRDSIKGYYRDEAQTFLTVPEWYLVFNPKEYADYLEAGEDPSDFPFYSSIDEYWKIYDRSKTLTSGAYPPNEEYLTMLDVIGVSITLEYTAKMLYENTLGQFFSWFSNGIPSDDEREIVKAQRAYSDFIYDKAWYEFRFMPWVKGVWRVSNNAESNWVRKVERKLFFTFEFTFKAAYATLIEWAAHEAYDESPTNIFALVATPDSLKTLTNVVVLDHQDEKKLIGIARWGSFTKAMLEMAEQDIKMLEIAGNDEILVSVLRSRITEKTVLQSQLLYTSQVVSNPDVIREVHLVSVPVLLAFIKELKQNNIELEHVYDY